MLTNIHFKDDLWIIKILLLFVSDWKQNTTTLNLFYDVIEKRVEKISEAQIFGSQEFIIWTFDQDKHKMSENINKQNKVSINANLAMS